MRTRSLQRPSVVTSYTIVLAMVMMWHTIGSLACRAGEQTRLMTIATELDAVTALDLSPSGSMVAVGCATGEVVVYTLSDTDSTKRTITGLGFEEINALEFSLQAERLIIGGAGDVFAGVINTATWETEYLSAGSRVIDNVHDIGGVVFYLRDASMRQLVMLDMTSSRPHIEFIAGSVSLVGHSIDRRRIVLIDQRQVMLLDAATMHVLSRTATILNTDVTAIGMVGKGYTALLGTTNGDVLILDVLDGRVVDTMAQAHTGAIRAIEVTEEGIYTAGDDGRVRRWSGYEQHAAVATILEGDHPVIDIGVTYNGDRVAAVTANGTIHVFGPPRQPPTPSPDE